jgi:hypothetical protein
MLRASLGKVVHTVNRAGTYAAKVSHKELHKIAVHVRAVGGKGTGRGRGGGSTVQFYVFHYASLQFSFIAIIF